MKILVVGANGKMGQEMKKYITSLNQEFFGIDKNNREEIFVEPDVILDFSSPDALLQNLQLAKKYNIPIVIATTGHTKENYIYIKEYSNFIPVFMSSNFSILFNLMQKLCKEIKGNFDFVLSESHHKTKKDKPSGSACSIIKILNKNNIKPKVICNRVSNVVGEHQLDIYSKDEKLSLSHTAYSKQVFCEGAFKVCEYIVTKQNGFYSMEDYLNDCL